MHAWLWFSVCTVLLALLFIRVNQGRTILSERFLDKQYVLVKGKKTIDHTYATNISQTIGIIGQDQPIYFSVLDYTEDHGLPKQEILCHSNLCVYYSMAQLIMLLISRAPAA
jgi:hypothetical protein